MVKRNLRNVACAFGILMFAGAAHAADIAIDGGLETAGVSGFPDTPVGAVPPGWVAFSGSGSVGTTSINPHSGTFAGQLTQNNPAANAVLKNANLTPALANSPVEVSFWARGSSAAGGVAFAELFSELAGGGTSKSEILGGGPLALDADPDVWKQFVFNTTSGGDVSGGLTVQFAVVTGGDGGSFSELFVDDVSVKVVPIPAAVWLLGSGLIGLIGLARRKRMA